MPPLHASLVRSILTEAAVNVVHHGGERGEHALDDPAAPQLDQRLRPPAHARASAAGLDNPRDFHLPPRRVSLRHGSLSSWAIACPAPATSDFLTSATITPARSSRLIQSRLCRPDSAPLSTVAIRSRDGKARRHSSRAHFEH